MRVPSFHLGSSGGDEVMAGETVGTLVAATHRTTWQDLGVEDSGAPGILEAEEVVGSTVGSLVAQ